MIKEIPMLFSTPMVQAIIEGRKTQTRREIKNRHFLACLQNPAENGLINLNNACPYGEPNDLIWVRETWGYDASGNDILFKATHNPECLWGSWKPSIHMPKKFARIWLEVVSIKVERLQDISEPDAIKEGIEPTATYDSGEGVYPGRFYKNYLPHGYMEVSARHSFQSLWQSINGLESWCANPWVWVVEFRVLSTNGKPDK